MAAPALVEARPPLGLSDDAAAASRAHIAREHAKRRNSDSQTLSGQKNIGAEAPVKVVSTQSDL